MLVPEVADLHEGGQERHRCGPAEAPEFVVDTTWYHLVAPDLACSTETLTIGGDRLAVSLVTYTLAAADIGCCLMVDESVSSMTGDFQCGWTGGLDRLERMVKENAFA